MENTIRRRTVKLIATLLRPFSGEGVITAAEEKEIIANLHHLAEKGTLKPMIVPKLIDQKEAAEMLGIGHANFKKLESEKRFPFRRKMVGSSVRYRNLDVLEYIMSPQDQD